MWDTAKTRLKWKSRALRHKLESSKRLSLAFHLKNMEKVKEIHPKQAEEVNNKDKFQKLMQLKTEK